MARKIATLGRQNNIANGFRDGGITRVIHWYPHLLGGGGVASSVLAIARAQANAGAEVLIAAREAEGCSPPNLNHEHISQILWHRRSTHFLGRIIRSGPSRAGIKPLLAFKPDIVHVHGEFNPDNLCVPKWFDVPLVVSPHGCFHPGVFTKRKSARKRLYFILAQQRLYRHANFHATSPMEVEHINKRLPHSRVFCVPLGPGSAMPDINLHHVKKDPHDPIRLLYVGRLDIYTKGLDILFDALAHVQKKLSGQKIILDLVGRAEGDEQKILQSRAAKLSITDIINFHGQKSPTEVTDLMSRSDVYVQLSRHEGFGLSILEALLMGLPAVLSTGIGIASFQQVRCLPQVIMTPPWAQIAADAISQAIVNNNEMRKQAAPTVPFLRSYFSWENAGEMLLKEYGGLLAESPSGKRVFIPSNFSSARTSSDAAITRA